MKTLTLSRDEATHQVWLADERGMRLPGQQRCVVETAIDGPTIVHVTILIERPVVARPFGFVDPDRWAGLDGRSAEPLPADILPERN